MQELMCLLQEQDIEFFCFFLYLSSSFFFSNFARLLNMAEVLLTWLLDLNIVNRIRKMSLHTPIICKPNGARKFKKQTKNNSIRVRYKQRLH